MYRSICMPDGKTYTFGRINARTKLKLSNNRLNSDKLTVYSRYLKFNSLVSG